MSKFFTAHKIFENVTQIAGLGGELCYLVEGKERALLIDGLCGVGSLKAFVRELTDLPVTLALTHGHLDHAGAAFEYGECLVHPADVALLYNHGDPARRYDFVMRGHEARAFQPRVEDVVLPRAVKTLPMLDGDAIDLGGVVIEAMGVPGHRAVYSGDACNPNTLLALPGSTTVETYRESLRRFEAILGAFDCFYGGHGTDAVPKSIVPDAIALCDEILERRDDAYPMAYIGRDFLYARRFSGDFKRADGGLANIAYLEDNIYNK